MVNLDIAVGTNEFPLVGRAFQKERISTIGCIAKSEFIYLIGRKDRGIEKVTDLEGKRVGITFRTIGTFLSRQVSRTSWYEYAGHSRR